MGWLLQLPSMNIMSLNSMKAALQFLHRQPHPDCKGSTVPVDMGSVNNVPISPSASASPTVVDCGCNPKRWNRRYLTPHYHHQEEEEEKNKKKEKESKKNKEKEIEIEMEMKGGGTSRRAFSYCATSTWICQECVLRNSDDNDDDMNRNRSRRRCRVHGKVEDSVVVVKRSCRPLAEFRWSMAVVVVQQQMRRASELRGLLECFLALNAPEHHGLIMEAFADVCISLLPHLTTPISHSPSPSPCCPSPHSSHCSSSSWINDALATVLPVPAPRAGIIPHTPLVHSASPSSRSRLTHVM